MAKEIRIKGAREHNLKNIDVTIPRDKVVVITGLSGSGKSSLAFDTIYAEGQRRYVESLSAYARQFLGLMEKPDVDFIEGLSPAISIDQKSASHNPRSTVGTVTEIYDHLRLLFAHIGIPHCPKCGKSVAKQSVDEIVEQIKKIKKLNRFMVLAPLVSAKKGEHRNILTDLKKDGYARVRINGKLMELSEPIDLDKKKKHTIEAVVDRLEAEMLSNEISANRLHASVTTALRLGNGNVVLALIDDQKPNKTTEYFYSENFACAKCDISLPEISPRSFSFNNPLGACPHCTGLGSRLEIDSKLIIPNPRLTIAEGGIRPWQNALDNGGWQAQILKSLAKEHKFSLNEPIGKIPKIKLEIVLYGTGGGELDVMYENSKGQTRHYVTNFEGVIPNLERRYKETDSDYIRNEINKYMILRTCPICGGKRLKPEYLAVTVGDKSILDIAEMSVVESNEFFEKLPLSPKEKLISKQILKEVRARLQFLVDVGLKYLTLDRTANTLSGGEAQRIRLATQIGSGLSGVIYILDEPSIGLHQKDNAKLIETLKHLRDLGNTIIVVEHDEETMRASDYVIDMGPGAGRHGGRVVAAGTVQEIIRHKNSLTGRYLKGKDSIEIPAKRREPNGKYLEIVRASENNLQNVSTKIPLGVFSCVTGVSGSGKSTLVNDILAKSLLNQIHGSRHTVGEHKTIKGVDNIDKVILIDQSPIGRTPRSNPGTYTGVFTDIRQIFTMTAEAKVRGYDQGKFSFNVKGGRCEACAGDGFNKIEMHFLPDVYVPCEVCRGQRYNKATLEIRYKGKNIADVLDMTVNEALTFFENIPTIKKKLITLQEVGLGYIKIGQPSNTLSGGEAQRIKLASELSRQSTSRTLYILDEPTTGLHFDDIKKLLKVLNTLVGRGNSVLVIEHNLDVIKTADWIIDLGPEGGKYGGEIIAEGTPEQVAKIKKSFTGAYLSRILKK